MGVRLFHGRVVRAYDINDHGWYLGVPPEGAEGIVGYCRERLTLVRSHNGRKNQLGGRQRTRTRSQFPIPDRS
jgi:hypothetical protein